MSEGNQWFKDGQPIAGATGNTLAIDSHGSYTVRVMVNGCSGMSEAVTLTSSEVDLLESDLHMFPNPATEKVKVYFHPTTASKSASVTLLNAIGKAIKENMPMKKANEGWELEVTTDRLPVGNYFLKVSDKRRVIVKPFIKL